MQLRYVSRPWMIKAFLKVLRFVFGIFAAAGAYQLYQMTKEFGKSGSGMILLSLLAFVVIAGGISATSNLFLTESGSIRASAQGVRLATIKRLPSVPDEAFVEAALDLRKKIEQDTTVRETFLAHRGKVIEQLSALQVDENLRLWAANQMAAARLFYLLGVSIGATTGSSEGNRLDSGPPTLRMSPSQAADSDAERKRLGEEVFSQAFAENGLDEFQKQFSSVDNLVAIGETEWTIAGGTKYVLTTDRLLIPGKRNQVWSSVPLRDVAELTVRG